MKFCFKTGIKATESHVTLIIAYADERPPRTNALTRFGKFREGRESVQDEDDPPAGHVRTARTGWTPVNTKAVPDVRWRRIVV